MRILLIGNPVSGRGKTLHVVNRFVDYISDRGHTVHVECTTGPGSAFKIASRIQGEYDRLIIAGGDGTANEVINGANLDLIPPFLIIPTGTANILARELELPKAIPKLVDIMERGKVVKIDMGLVNNRRFLLLVSSGFDALVTKQINGNRQEHLGFRGYVIPILKSFREYYPSDLEVTIDSGKKIYGKLVIIQKVNKYGGIFEFSKNASLTSGVFEVCVFPKGSLIDIFRYGLAGFLRLSKFMTEIQRLTAKNLRIDSFPPNPVEVDGDYFGDTPVDVRLAPAAIRVITP